MATIPNQRTWTDGEIVTAAELNSNIRDAVNFLMNPPAAKVERQITTQSIPDRTYQQITFDTEDNDTDNMYDAANNDHLLINTPGVYSVTGIMSWAANATGQRQVLVSKTTALGDAVLRAENEATSSNSAIYNVTGDVRCTAGDKLYLLCWQNTGAALVTFQGNASAPILSARWVGQ